MKKIFINLILIVIGFVIYFLQSNFFNWFSIAGVKPNLFIVYILFIGLFYNDKTPYTKMCTILGTLGLWGGIMVIISTIRGYPKFIPLLERTTVYPIIFFQIITGIYFLIIENQKSLN